MKPMLFGVLFLFFQVSVSSYAQIPPRTFLEYRVPTHGRSFSVILTASIPGDACNEFDIEGKFLEVQGEGRFPKDPTFVADVILSTTAVPCFGSPPVLTNIHRIFRFDSIPGERHVRLLIPAEFAVDFSRNPRHHDDFEDDR